MITKMKDTKIIQVAGLHRQELSGFLPELGEEFLELFYKASLKLPEMFTYIDEEKSQVRGFVSNISQANGLYRKIFFKLPWKFILIFLKYFITHPYSLDKFFRILTYPGFRNGGAELLSLVVSRDCRLQGIGRRLVIYSAKEFNRRGIKKFKISVYDSLAANGFYKKIGCRLVSSFDFLGEKMNYYEFKIR